MEREKEFVCMDFVSFDIRHKVEDRCHLEPCDFVVRAMKNKTLVLHPESRVTTACVATAVLVLPLHTLDTEVTLQVNFEHGPLGSRAVPHTT